LKKSKDGE